ncbi:MAG: RNA polymerase sigma factor [Phycisphaerae bacterium]|nr:RNA polymerase sigma factor [Phycisphaerae bacterium]
MSRIDGSDCLELVKQAQLGDQVSLDRLAGLLRPKVYAYIYRLTLDYHLAEDLSQETLLELVKSFSFRKLAFKSAGMFSSWLFRTALGKVQIHFRDQAKRIMLMSAIHNDVLSRVMSSHHTDGLTALMRKELSTAVFQAISKLRLSYRNVLALRCFEQMSYSAIAAVMDCSEVRVRVLVFRAQRSLKRQLSQYGFSKTLFLTALGLFGRITAPAEASATAPVTAAAIKVGLAGTLVGAAGTTIGIAAGTAVVATVLAIGTITVLSNDRPPKRSEVRSIRYVFHSPHPDRAKAVDNISEAIRESRFYFPDGIDGPVFRRNQAWTLNRQFQFQDWLQNGQGSYEYQPPRHVIIHNCNGLYPEQTLILLSDPSDFRAFVRDVEGKRTAGITTYDEETGLPVGRSQVVFDNVEDSYVKFEYNTLDQADFQHTWPSDVIVIDQRDAMHKRGWTYFRITGQINNEQISGYGQIPFIYDALREHPPWLRLNIGDRLQITDIPSGARLANSAGTLVAALPSGSFFRGLPQPWMGMHTLDIVRRNAAKHRLWFQTRLLDNIVQHPFYRKAKVTVLNDRQGVNLRLTYLIDMQKDVVESIRIASSSGDGIETRGVIRFEYLEDVEQVADEFIEPIELTPSEVSPKKNMVSFWLMELAQGALSQPVK